MLMKYFSGKILQENHPTINQKRCINFYSKMQKCTRCRDACPVDAIIINSKSVYADEESCKGCGVCGAVCPAQTISFKKNEEIKAIRKLEEKEIIVVGCNQEGNGGNITFSCLNGLHHEYLAAFLVALKGKKVYFNLCKCENCYMKDGSKGFEDSLKTVITFIKHFDFDPQIELLFNEENIPQYMDQTISRRDLFTLFKRQSTNVVSEIVDDAIGRESQLIQRDFILEYMDDLISKSRGDIEIPQSESFFTNWTVNNNCSGCGLCQTMCPSKAWKVEKHKGYVRISHNARLCTSCGLCEDICPQNSLSKDQFSTALLVGFILKKELSLNLCKQCSKEYVPNKEDNGLCHICEKRKLVKKSILQI